MPIIIPIKDGRRAKGTELEMILIAPLRRPDAPMPAMARPTMNMVDDWAAPQSTEPISKIRKKHNHETLRGKEW